MPPRSPATSGSVTNSTAGAALPPPQTPSSAVAPVVTTAVGAPTSSDSREVGTGERYAGWRATIQRWISNSARRAGEPATAAIAMGLLAFTASMGMIVGFSERWQLMINTCALFVTFGMVFLIQLTQARNNREIERKLDLILRGSGVTDLDLASLPEAQLVSLDARIRQLTAGRLQDAYDDQGPTQVLDRQVVDRSADSAVRRSPVTRRAG
ncbi:MAG TPA: low affinity iron permease family protein [Polyangiaceae bacterium]|nr:low affinity iron permease family protein [Polyangiaceae bacterium]